MIEISPIKILILMLINTINLGIFVICDTIYDANKEYTFDLERYIEYLDQGIRERY